MKSGFLWKQRDHMGGGYRLRYFVLEGNRLVYRKTETGSNEKVPRGSLYMEGCTITCRQRANWRTKGHQFVIAQPNDAYTYRLACDTKEEAGAWVQALRAAASLDASQVRTALQETSVTLVDAISPWLFPFYPLVMKQTGLGYGRLYLHVIEAQNLTAADFSFVGAGSSDPYVVAEVGV